VLLVAAEVHFQAKLGEHGGFDAASAMGLLDVVPIGKLVTVRAVLGSHFVHADAVEHSMHDGFADRRRSPLVTN